MDSAATDDDEIEITIRVDRDTFYWLDNLALIEQENACDNDPDQFTPDFMASIQIGLLRLYCLEYDARDFGSLYAAILEDGITQGADVGMSATLEALGIRKAEKGVGDGPD